MPDPDLDRVLEQAGRRRSPREPGGAWYEIAAKADSRTATVRIFDEIGWLGTTARDFATEISGLDVDEIDLRLNSPGGDAFDGIAIYNSLRAHPATVTVTVDALAASAASLIAMAGDKVRMNRGSQMMIHDAAGVVIGNAADMQEWAAVLNKTSDSYASIYAARAGGTVEQWRKAMAAETWYLAAEAVEAGLADELAEEVDGAQARSRFDLKAYAFAYAGRDQAPPPVLTRRPDPAPFRDPDAPAKPGDSASPPTAAEAARRIHAAPTRTTTKEGAGRMDPAKIREALGLKADACDDEVKAALASAGLQPTPIPPDEPDPEPDPTPSPAPKAAGTMTLDVAAWQEQQDRIRRLEAQAARQRAAERDQVIDQAVADGKFTPARKDHWARLWDADPEGTRTVIEGLAKNVVPVAELGYGADAEADLDDEFRKFFPPEPARKGA